MPIVNELIKKSAIYIKEEIYETYKPKLVKYIRLHVTYKNNNSLESLLDELESQISDKSLSIEENVFVKII